MSDPVCIMPTNYNGNLQKGLPVFKTVTGSSNTLSAVLRRGYSSEDAPADLTGLTDIRFIAKPLRHRAQKIIDVSCHIVDPSTGEVAFTLPESGTKLAGIFYAGFMGKEGSLNKWQLDAWLYIEKGLDHNIENNSPITFEDIRQYLNDRCPEDNDLLQDTMYSDSDCAASMVWAIDLYNSTPPPIFEHTACDFPWRTAWIKAAAGFLLKSAGHRYIRNRLQYSAGTVSVDDKIAGEKFVALAKELETEYLQWIVATKVSINIDQSYGCVESPVFGVRQ